jgi:hypothetical protein
VYPKVSGLVACYNSLPLDTVVSVFYEVSLVSFATILSYLHVVVLRNLGSFISAMHPGLHCDEFLCRGFLGCDTL